MAKSKSSAADKKLNKARDKELKDLEAKVKGAQTPEEQTKAFETLTAKYNEYGRPVKSLTDLKTSEIASSTLREGTDTHDEDLGKPREIKAAQIGEFERAQATQIAPIERVTRPDLGQVERFAGATLSPAERITAATVGPAFTIDAAQIDRAGGDPYRTKQLALADALERQARGEGPSLAQLQLQAAGDRLIANQRAVIASQRGVNPGLALRTASRGAGDLGAQLAQQAVIARLQEQRSAQEQLGAVTASGQSIEAQIAANQAALVQASAQGNQQAINALTAERAQLEQQASLANQAAGNRAAEVQAGLAQQAGLANQAATNQRQVEQGEINLRADLANQIAENTRGTNQASLDQSTNVFNAGQANTRTLQQATLEQAATQGNQSAVNTSKLTQGSINAGVSQAEIAAGAQIAAANAAANAAITAANIGANASTTNAAINAATNLGNQGAQQGGAAETAGSNATASNNQSGAQITGSLIQAGGSVGAALASDERLKKDVKPAGRDVRAFLDALDAESYRYKNPGRDGKGEKVGVMAQDLEKTKSGKSMVEDTPDGKHVNFQRGLAVILAAVADLNKRTKQLEGGKA